jgi:hypothetical protein
MPVRAHVCQTSEAILTAAVGQNAQPIRSVQATKRVSTKSVSIHAIVDVAPTLNVTSSDTVLNAHVWKVMKEIPSTAVDFVK